ncbi:MAG: c-type cytochrome domain-containing protein [Opitutales bacterium]
MVILHLPIGLLLGVILSELLQIRKPASERGWGHTTLLGATFLTSILAAVCGYLLSWEPSYDAEAIRLHRLGGLFVAYLSGFILVGFLFFKQLKVAYYLGLLGLCYAVYFTGHAGGSLTHGPSFLTEYLESTDNESVAPAAQVEAPDSIFHKAVMPQLDTYCVRCHGPERVRANLRLDTMEGILAGGNRGAVLVPGKPEESSLVTFMLLPLDDDDHMPPNGKLQPDPEVAELISWWIETGASETSSIEEFSPPDALASFFIEREALPLMDPTQVQSLLAGADFAPFKIYPLAADDFRLSVTASSATDADLSKLQPLRANIVELNLANSPISDAGVETLSSFLNLDQLRLNNTQITDASAGNIAELYQLTYINLASTEIGDTSLAQLETIRSLQKVYLWDTQVTASAAERLQERLYPKVAAERLRNEIEALKHQFDALRVTVDTGI